MSTSSTHIVPLNELIADQEADLFALLSGKESLRTRDGKPYFRVTFRDAQREISFPIWSDSPWAGDCRDQWQLGEFYKLRAIYRETNYGPQLEIQRIRPVREDDQADGFDPQMLMPRSRFDPSSMYDNLLQLVDREIDNPALAKFVRGILTENRAALLTLPAATHFHHAFAGGFLEHVLNVAQTCVYLADQYTALYDELNPPLDKRLIVAGAVLHDIGKLRELTARTEGAAYTDEGQLIGHILQGRDMIRERATECPIDEQLLLRLEHIIVAHQRLPEWGSPKQPMTPEALIVHHADDLDAKLQMMVAALSDHDSPENFTSRKNPLKLPIYRGPQGDNGADK